MRISIFTFVIVCFLSTNLRAQMYVDGDTLYGNEWIDYSKTYLKFSVEEQGIYQINFSDIQNQFPAGIRGDELRLYNYGEEQHVFLSDIGVLGADDYLLFYGQANDSRLDSYLYDKNNTAAQINPHYSFYSDKNAYFLSYSEASSDYIYQEAEIINTAGLEPESALNTFKRINISDQHYKKTSGSIKLSLFDYSEAYGSVFSHLGAFDISDLNPAESNSDASLILHYFNHSDNDQAFLFRLNDNLLYESNVSYIGSYKDSVDVSSSLLTNNNSLTFEAPDPDASKISLSLIELWYETKPSIINKTFLSFHTKQNTDQYFEVNSNADEDYLLFDLTNKEVLSIESSGSSLSFGLAGATYRSLFMCSTNNISTLNDFEAINFIDYTDNLSEMLIIYNDLLSTEANGNNIIEEYASYHREESPYVKTVNTAEINQISDQFAYGVKLHPMGIRNLGHFYRHNSTDFRYLLLIGKSIRHRSYRKNTDFDNNYGSILFLPTIGDFSSDNLFTSNNQDYIPSFSVGRIAAIKPSEIRAYFEKLKEYEAVKSQAQSFENKLWTKRILHLVGGEGENEENTIFNYLQSAGNALENNSFGAKQKTFRKFYDETIITESFGLIQNQVNAGLAIINVFGHSNSNFTQYGIDDVSIYSNKGKYPLFISGGCYSGTCSNDVPALGESITLASEKAGICYLGVSGFGFISSLGSFMNAFYTNIGTEHYGLSIGDALIKTHNDINSGGSVIRQQLIYQGDPSLHFYYHDKPDYTIGEEIEIISPSLSSSLDSFSVEIPFYNLGKNINTPLIVNISMEYPNKEIIPLRTDTIEAPAYLRELEYKLPVLDKEKIVGLNRLLISVDVFNNIEEQENGGESNNNLVYSDGQTGYPLLFISNDLKPVLPFNFHQKDKLSFDFYSHSNNYSSTEKNYLMELDTSLLFDSPDKILLNQTSKGGLINWTSSLELKNEQIYYWRTAAETDNNSDLSWNESSFVINDDSSEGWHQSHYQQYEQDTFVNLAINSDSKRLKFKDDALNLSILNIAAQSGVFPVVKSDFGRYFLYYSPSNPVGVGFVIIDPDNLQCVPGLENNGQEQIYAYPWANGEGHIFNTSSPEQREEVVNFIENIIPDGSYVAFMTLQFNPNQDYKPEEWASDSLIYGSNIFQALENKGSNIVRNLETSGSVPYGFIYQEGNSSFLSNEVVSTTPIYYSYTTVQVEGNFNQGYLKSQHIGPASSWGRLQYELSEVESNDSVRIDLFGIDTLNNIELLNSYTTEVVDEDISQLVDASIYPEIFLNYFVSDPLNTSVPKLDYWTVEFESVPEVCVAPNISFELRDTIYKGEQIDLTLAVKNISAYDMDSLLVKTTFIDETGYSEVSYKRYAAVSAEEVLVLENNYETASLRGLTKLILEINPNEDQAELNFENNVLSTNIMILEDLIDPLLAVRFDGKRIINGDLVAPSPMISIQVKDDNPNLLLNDTSFFDIKIKYPDQSIHTVYFNETGVTFQAAEDADNLALIEFVKEFEQDGIYTLYVAAKDVSGNSLSNLSESPNFISAGLDYKLDFEVINKSMISNFYNYPNPFSTATRFVYTLTGDKLPSYFKIQILTASGKIVREVSQAEFGPLLPGTNQSEFVWDGRDAYGDSLANGVYLYKIIAKDENGDNFEKYDLNDAESLHFLNGYGKMVLIR